MKLGRAALLVLQLAAAAAALRAQAPTPQDPARQAPQAGVRVDTQNDVLLDDAVRRLQGLSVRSIQFARSTGPGAPKMLDAAASEPLVRSLLTRVGQGFEARKVTNDCTTLWEERRLIVSAYALQQDQEVSVTFVVEQEVEIYASVEFRGLDKLARSTVNDLLGIDEGRQITATEARAMSKVLLARYARDGFPFASVRLDEEAVPESGDAGGAVAPGGRSAKKLLFRVDEGPRVTVRNLEFVGNDSYPVEPNLGVLGSGEFLARDPNIKSDPAWGFINGGYYSREILDEDLDRLRLFYRGRGFLDATVDVADVRYSGDRTEVDIKILVVEGPRYKIRSVRIEHADGNGGPLTEPPRYSPDEIAKELKIVPGEFYDFGRLQRDWLAIQDFYGQRGHPPSSFPGMANVPQPCRVVWPPREIYGDGNVVDVTFQVVEGQPKRLQDVVIRGNRFTRDAVIRRRVRVKPGERIDMREVQRSLRNLEQTRYFLDPDTLRGPRLQLEPAAGAIGDPDLVDLGIDLQDAPTGELRWGVGISTGQGATASMTFNKRNFDAWNPPSTANPIDAFVEVLDNEAFHGGGQTFSTLLAPGSRYSQFRVSWTEPDIFGEHYDTHELRLSGERLIRRLRDGYTADTLQGEIGLSRYFTDEFSVGVAARHSTVDVEDLAADATSIAYAAEGQNELRGLRLSARYRDYDDLRSPTEGYEVSGSIETIGGWLGGDQDIVKFDHTLHWYLPVAENEMGHRTVLHLEHRFGLAQEFGQSEDVFVTERYYMGGSNLRGFEYRRAGPSQFGRPFGGEILYTATAELFFPLVSTRLDGEVRDRELLRGVLFTDIGLLGLDRHDPSFSELRGSSGIGIRIEVPMLELPIAIDIGWPWMYEETDDRQQLFFTISK